MDFLEVLRSQGLSELKISEIANTMKKNRVFVTYEEKIEERYRKMRLQRDCLRYKLDLAERALEELQLKLSVNEDIRRIRKVFAGRTITVNHTGNTGGKTERVMKNERRGSEYKA